jgi:hypothetical protein
MVCSAEVKLQKRIAMRGLLESRSTRFLRRTVIILTAVAAFNFMMVVPVAADHLEGKQQAIGKQERILSGIDIYKTTIAEVIKMYGKPASRRDLPVKGVKDGVGGYRDYIWEFNGLRLLAATGYHNDKESGVYSVDVWGAAPQGDLGKTAHGLALGSTLEQQKALYGDRFFVSSTYGKKLPSGPDTKGKVKSVLLQWRDGTQLVIDYDSKGRVSHMQLSADIE